MAAIDLIVTIPDDPALQAKIVEAVEYMDRKEDAEGNVTIPDLTPAQVKNKLETYMRKQAVRAVRAALKDKAQAQAESVDF